MDKQYTHVFIAVSEEYRKLRERQTFLNRLAWSTELCYSYFLSKFDNNKSLADLEIDKIFENLPIQAWSKNKSGSGKYNVTLNEHINNVKENQAYICRSVLILYHSNFEKYLKRRANTKPFFLNLTTPKFKIDNINIDLKKILKADCCRLIRNIIVHQPENTFLSIKDVRGSIKEKIIENLTKETKRLEEDYSQEFIKEQLGKAINEVIDAAISEVQNASERNLVLPYEFFFMIFTFTNYDNIAAEIEQALYFDAVPKTFYNRIKRSHIRQDRHVMITAPAVIGRIYNLKNDMPIHSATISVVNTPYKAVSNENGNYYLTPNLKDGEYTITIKAEGCEKKDCTINTVVGKTIQLDFGLYML